MMRSAQARKIPMFLVTYPLAGGFYAPVNGAVRSVSAAFGVPYVDTTEGTAAAHAEDPKAQLFDTWVHPMPIVYRQIAEQVYRLLVAQGLVTPTQ
jgi:hypothetical protein